MQLRSLLHYAAPYRGRLALVAALMLAMIIPTAFFIGGVLNHGLRLIF